MTLIRRSNRENFRGVLNDTNFKHFFLKVIFSLTFINLKKSAKNIFSKWKSSFSIEFFIESDEKKIFNLIFEIVILGIVHRASVSYLESIRYFEEFRRRKFYYEYFFWKFNKRKKWRIIKFSKIFFFFFFLLNLNFF